MRDFLIPLSVTSFGNRKFQVCFLINNNQTCEVKCEQSKFRPINVWEVKEKLPESYSQMEQSEGIFSSYSSMLQKVRGTICFFQKIFYRKQWCFLTPRLLVKTADCSLFFPKRGRYREPTLTGSHLGFWCIESAEPGEE